MNKFKVGDLVTLRKDSFYNNDSFNNPFGEIGKVSLLKEVVYGLPINVRWKSGYVNAYEESDLDHVVHDNKLNRALYPEYKTKVIDDKTYLVYNDDTDGGNE